MARFKGRCVVAAWLVLGCMASTAQAFRLELGTGIGAEYSTNVLRSESDRERDTLGYVWAGLSAQEESANLTAEIAGVVETQQYFNDTASDEVLFSLAALVDWMILPQRLSWHLENYFQQSTEDPFSTYSPHNQQDTNVLWTGPDLYFRFARLYTLQLGARYGNFYYEETDGDNQRYAGFARLSRQLTPSTELFLQGQRTKVDYDHDGRVDAITGVPIRDFDRDDVLAGLRWESVLTVIELEGGYSWISRDDDADINGALGRLHALRRLPNEGGAGLRLSSELTEAGEDLLTSGGGRLGVDPHGTGVREDIARELYGELYYYGHWMGVASRIRLYWLDEDYEESALDERRTGATLDLGYPIAPAWRLGVFGLHEKRKFDLIDRRDRRSLIGSGLSHLLSREISIDFGLQYEWQNSNTAGHDFREWLALVELRYGVRPYWAAR